MALWAGGDGNPSFIDWRVRVDLRFNPMDAVAGGASWSFRPPSFSEHSMGALNKLFGDVRMAYTTGLGDIGSKDR